MVVLPPGESIVSFLPLLFSIAFLMLIILPYWIICKKAGFKPALSLLILVPFVGILLLSYYLAFTEWKRPPVNKSVEYLAVGRFIHPE
jgi:hypothetical protein